MFTLDCHLDLSMNAMQWNRDLTKPVHELRALEKGMTDKKGRGVGTVAFPEMRKAQIGLCVATQIAHCLANSTPLDTWGSVEIAWAQTQAQLAWYRAMEERGVMVQIVDRAGLDKHVALWMNNPPADAPIGYILSLEGADSIRTPKHLERSYKDGLRIVGPAHYGQGRYAYGTGVSGPMGPQGRELLKEMRRLDMILDATHLCDESFWEAMDHWDGPVWASHQNCRALVPVDRQFDDRQIKELISRGAVFGGVLDAWMLVPGWVKRKSTPQELNVKFEYVIDHMDHICQLAGNARHICVGSDLDGGFGLEQGPMDLDTIADLGRLPGMLAERGYSPPDIEGVMHGNALRFLRDAWKK